MPYHIIGEGTEGRGHRGQVPPNQFSTYLAGCIWGAEGTILRNILVPPPIKISFLCLCTCTTNQHITGYCTVLTSGVVLRISRSLSGLFPSSSPLTIFCEEIFHWRKKQGGWGGCSPPCLWKDHTPQILGVHFNICLRMHQSRFQSIQITKCPGGACPQTPPARVSACRLCHHKVSPKSIFLRPCIQRVSLRNEEDRTL